MFSKLGAIEVPVELRSGFRHYERLEGVRKAEKLIEDATKAYLKVVQTAIANDSAIQSELAKEFAKEKQPKHSKSAIALAS